MSVVLLNIGFAYSRLGDQQQAISTYRKVLQLDADTYDDCIDAATARLDATSPGGDNAAGAQREMVHQVISSETERPVDQTIR